MRNKAITLLSGLLVFTFSGCDSLNTWGTSVPMGEAKFPAVPAEHVMILFAPPAKEYQQIGLVSSLGGMFASDGDMFKKMQKEAASMGADAIIVRSDGAAVTATGSGGVTVVQSQNSSGIYPKTNAIAIRYK